MGPLSLSSVLSFGNLILASANVIIGFSLLVYILTHNYRSTVARAFCALMAFVTIVFVVDIAVSELQSVASVDAWLRVQWVGIAMTPAAFFHFADAVLRATGAVSRWRRAGMLGAYLAGMAFLVAAVFTDQLVAGARRNGELLFQSAGPYFWVFAVYYVGVTLGGWLNVRRAQVRSLSSSSRRRMGYLTLAIIAPALGVFPFMLLTPAAGNVSPVLISALTLLGNLGIGLMTIVIGYIVAYQGVLLPDRVVKHSLIHYLLRGPLVAILVVALMLTVPKVENVLGLPRDTVLVVTVVAGVVVLQIVVSVIKPALDRLIYRKDRQEIELIQTLDQRLLTTTDLEQLLENTLIEVCDLLQAPSGFVMTLQDGQPQLKIFSGRAEAAAEFLQVTSPEALLERLARSRQDGDLANADLIRADGHWALPLRGEEGNTLGILGIAALSEQPEYSDEELETLCGLLQRLDRALEDIQLQRLVFGVLQRLGSELDQVQEWRSRPAYASEPRATRQESGSLDAPSLTQAVRDALTHLWGGPKLSQSPLADLHVVHERLETNGGVPARAIRAVLHEAIDRLKPEGKRSLTAGDWVLYNILDLRYVQGERVRDIAQRMAMSESDFYRKQRVAIEQVAQMLIQMEQASECARPADATVTNPMLASQEG